MGGPELELGPAGIWAVVQPGLDLRMTLGRGAAVGLGVTLGLRPKLRPGVGEMLVGRAALAAGKGAAGKGLGLRLELKVRAAAAPGVARAACPESRPPARVGLALGVLGLRGPSHCGLRLGCQAAVRPNARGAACAFWRTARAEAPTGGLSYRRGLSGREEAGGGPCCACRVGNGPLRKPGVPDRGVTLGLARRVPSLIRELGVRGVVVRLRSVSTGTFKARRSPEGPDPRGSPGPSVEHRRAARAEATAPSIAATRSAHRRSSSGTSAGHSRRCSPSRGVTCAGLTAAGASTPATQSSEFMGPAGARGVAVGVAVCAASMHLSQSDFGASASGTWGQGTRDKGGGSKPTQECDRGVWVWLTERCACHGEVSLGEVSLQEWRRCTGREDTDTPVPPHRARLSGHPRRSTATTAQVTCNNGQTQIACSKRGGGVSRLSEYPGVRTCSPFEGGRLPAQMGGLVIHPLGWGLRSWAKHTPTTPLQDTSKTTRPPAEKDSIALPNSSVRGRKAEPNWPSTGKVDWVSGAGSKMARGAEVGRLSNLTMSSLWNCPTRRHHDFASHGHIPQTRTSAHRS